MRLEVIATSVQDALTAEKCGADRIELITAFAEGGLTPGIGMVRQVVQAVSLPVHVMIRPHSRSFVYDRWDLTVMAEEIRAVQDAGAAGIVLGALTEYGEIDEAALDMHLPLAQGMNVTFHRAFDELANRTEGLRTLRKHPSVNRVLTSGGLRPAPQAVEEIRELVREAETGGPHILAGHGLTLEGISDFVRQTGVTEVHFGTAVRKDGSALQEIDPAKLKNLVHLLKP